MMTSRHLHLLDPSRAAQPSPKKAVMQTNRAKIKRKTAEAKLKSPRDQLRSLQHSEALSRIVEAAVVEVPLAKVEVGAVQRRASRRHSIRPSCNRQKCQSRSSPKRKTKLQEIRKNRSM